MELIAQVRWGSGGGVAIGQPQIAGLPLLTSGQYEEFFMRFGSKVGAHGYDLVERIVPPGFPAMAGQAIYRFRQKQQTSGTTLYQVGTGVFSANITPPYQSWKEFRPVVAKGIGVLLETRGGRRRGTPNKKTVLRNAAICAVAANPDLTPLDFLRGVMRDPDASPDIRIKAAQAAAPYVHTKPRQSALPGDPADGATLLGETGAFTISTAVAKALRDDHERLNYLVRKEAAPREYGGPLSAAEADEESRLRRTIAEKARAIGCPAGYGSREARRDGHRLHQLNCKRISPGGRLTGAEDIEEARLVARVAAFDESPEGCARRRIFELILEDFGRRAS